MSLTTRDVAHLLHTTPEAVKKLVQRGKLKTVRQGRGRPVYYDTSSVAAEITRRASS